MKAQRDIDFCCHQTRLLSSLMKGILRPSVPTRKEICRQGISVGPFRMYSRCSDTRESEDRGTPGQIPMSTVGASVSPRARSV